MQNLDKMMGKCEECGNFIPLEIYYYHKSVFNRAVCFKPECFTKYYIKNQKKYRNVLKCMEA